MSEAWGGHAVRWTPVLAAIWLATTVGCADRWLEAPGSTPGPAACPTGTVLDTSTGLCLAGGCSSPDECLAGYRCDPVAGRCALPKPGTPGGIDPQPITCVEGSRRCGGEGVMERCQDSRWAASACPAETACHAGACLFCAPAARRCVDDGSAAYQVCTGDGSGWLTTACIDPAATCSDGNCLICTPGASRCSAGTRTICNSSGTAWDESPCGTGSFCDLVPGGAVCTPVRCEPSSIVCDPLDPGRRHVCAADGSKSTELACPGGTSCRQPDGRCVDACTIAAADGHGAGCDYWFAQLPNGSGLDEETWQDVLQLANPGDQPVSVRLTSARHEAPLLDGGIVPAHSMLSIDLPRLALPGTEQQAIGFHLESNLPVLAHLVSRTRGKDFSACSCELEDCAPGADCVVLRTTAGGSLLLPAHLLGGTDEASSYAAWSPRHLKVDGAHQPALLAIVATRQRTRVEIGFGGETQASQDGEITSFAAGDAATFFLDEGHVLQFASAASGARTTFAAGGSTVVQFANDFVGTTIRSDGPVAIFAGAGLSGPRANADHLLEQLPPVDLWGRHFVGVAGLGLEAFEIVGGDEGALLAFSGPVVDMQGNPLQVTTLPARGRLRIRAAGDFQLRSWMPVMLLQVRSGYDGSTRPGVVVVPPLERSRSEHRLAIPPTASAMLHLIAPVSDAGDDATTVRIGSTLVGGWTRIAGTALQVARIPLCTEGAAFCNPEGEYLVHASAPVLVFVHTSGAYGISYAGGLGNGPGFSSPIPY